MFCRFSERRKALVELYCEECGKKPNNERLDRIREVTELFNATAMSKCFSGMSPVLCKDCEDEELSEIYRRSGGRFGKRRKHKGGSKGEECKSDHGSLTASANVCDSTTIPFPHESSSIHSTDNDAPLQIKHKCNFKMCKKQSSWQYVIARQHQWGLDMRMS